MEFTSILDLRPSPYQGMTGSAFLKDLNIDQIIDQIAPDRRDQVKSLYFYFPADRECEDYRRNVYADICRDGVYAVFSRFVTQMKDWRSALVQKETVEIDFQKYVWHIRETGYYCDALEELYAALMPLSLQSDGMRSFKAYLGEYLESDSYADMQKSMSSLRREMSGLKLSLTYDKDRIIVSEDSPAADYDAFLDTCFPGSGQPLKSPFAASSDLNELEEEILTIYTKKHSAFFRAAAAFYKAHKDYARDKLLQFRSEIQFYLAFYRFESKMRHNGFTFTAPATSDSEELQAAGLYDLALACANLPVHKEVVSNDMVYHEGERFFVLTGPNQGGKTTFARSLGQLVYFTKMGLNVPAASANVPYFNGILTHFSVEESVETGRGKLMEELTRLKPMMNERHTNAFVVINELFTTAANYDACIMGKRVLEHFIKQGCRGIYVTHLKELSDAHPQIVSLKAALNEEMVQNYKIIRNAAESIAYAANQVNKYHLTYEQLKLRLQTIPSAAKDEAYARTVTEKENGERI